MATIKVKPWGKNQGDFVLIDESNFDSEKHEKLTASQEPKKTTRKQTKKPA